jgi:hypothetical protein
LRAAAAFGALAGAGVIDQNAPDDLSAYSAKMCTIMPVGFLLIDETQIRLMHQIGALQGVARALPPELAVRQLAEFRIDKRRQLVNRRYFARVPLLE